MSEHFDAMVRAYKDQIDEILDDMEKMEGIVTELKAALSMLMDCAELNQDSLEDETIDAIEFAEQSIAKADGKEPS